jgi:hypothetical protein
MAVARGQASGDLEVPADFKPSSLVGEAMRTRKGETTRGFVIFRAYTLPKSVRFGRKRVRFKAKPA